MVLTQVKIVFFFERKRRMTDCLAKGRQEITIITEIKLKSLILAQIER